MVSATRWRQDTHSAPNNPNQKLRWYPTYPSGGNGFSTFGWSPMPEPTPEFKLVGSPAGYMSRPGLSGLRAPFIPSWSSLAKVVGAALGIVGGIWLAHKNLE